MRPLLPQAYISSVNVALNGYDLPVLEPRITQRVSYPSTAAAGMTVLDTEPEGEAAKECIALLTAVKAMMR